MENKDSRDSKGNISKRKKSMIVQKERPTCSHCQRIGHDESKCWKLHPELKPKKFLKAKDERKAIAVVQQDLSLDSGDERKIIAMVMTGKTSDTSSSLKSNVSSSNINPPHEDKRVELFHTRITAKHTKIDTMLDSASQSNLIYEHIVNQLGSETHNHPRPYPLGWINKST